MSFRAIARRTVVLAAVLGVAAPRLLGAHAVVYPKSSAPGAYERYVLRVPNEKAVATTRVELRVPRDVRVTAFAEVPGWRLEVLTDSAKRIVGAVWTGVLPPQRFIELPFVAANPKANAQLVWPATQTYEDGERVEWSGAEGTKTPASITRIAATGDAAPRTPLVSWIALALALVSLGLVLRPARHGAA